MLSKKLIVALLEYALIVHTSEKIRYNRISSLKYGK